jgi:hypothetical protein
MFATAFPGLWATDRTGPVKVAFDADTSAFVHTSDQDATDIQREIAGTERTLTTVICVAPAQPPADTRTVRTQAFEAVGKAR